MYSVLIMFFVYPLVVDTLLPIVEGLLTATVAPLVVALVSAAHDSDST
jgi:hypothetical protein